MAEGWHGGTGTAAGWLAIDRISGAIVVGFRRHHDAAS
jgi:hypothetical protein